MTGIVLHVHALEGEAVAPGALLFQIRLTHEDLVQAQTAFLQTLAELDVEQREIARLEKVTQSGVVPRVRLLERQYARDKLQALLSAQREALRLHGLTEEQIESITQDRRLLRELHIFAPRPDEHSENELRLVGQTIHTVAWQLPRAPAAPHDPPLQDQRHAPDAREHQTDTPLVISKLSAHKGQSVLAGETLCVLSDYRELYIEGLAFEQDAEDIAAAAARKWPAEAVFETAGNRTRVVGDLAIVRISNEIDADSRTLRFYVRLPNEIESRTAGENGHEYVSWRYRPGQRLQLRVPVEEWPDQIVLPVDAVVKEGAEFYVFQQNGNHFDRVPVHVKYRDQSNVVIANDGSLFPGDVVALRGAHQMQMALKNKAGSGADPHAGHSH